MTTTIDLTKFREEFRFYLKKNYPNKSCRLIKKFTLDKSALVQFGNLKFEITHTHHRLYQNKNTAVFYVKYVKALHFRLTSDLLFLLNNEEDTLLEDLIISINFIKSFQQNNPDISDIILFDWEHRLCLSKNKEYILKFKKILNDNDFFYTDMIRTYQKDSLKSRDEFLQPYIFIPISNSDHTKHKLLNSLSIFSKIYSENNSKLRENPIFTEDSILNLSELKFNLYFSNCSIDGSFSILQEDELARLTINSQVFSFDNLSDIQNYNLEEFITDYQDSLSLKTLVMPDVNFAKRVLDKSCILPQFYDDLIRLLLTKFSGDVIKLNMYLKNTRVDKISLPLGFYLYNLGDLFFLVTKNRYDSYIFNLSSNQEEIEEVAQLHSIIYIDNFYSNLRAKTSN